MKSEKNKPHLLLVHSFPTNSVLLHGLEEFLADYFVVHFINLPGFHKENPAYLGPITFKKFSNYFEQKIAEIDAEEYVVAGVSFGFLVVNNAKLDKRCKAIVALEPYINNNCLNISYWKKKQYIGFAILLKTVNSLGIEGRIWKSKWFNKYIQKFACYPKERVDQIIHHIDPRTFFTVAHSLLTYNKEPHFHPLPYFLVGNFADKTINFNYVVEVFIKNLHELHITSEPIDHYPKDLSKTYFKTRIPHEHIQRILACIDGKLPS